MRTRLYSMALLGAGLLALPALAQPPEGPRDGDRPKSDPAMKQKLLDAFDTNKDGTIDRAEARVIGRALHENFGIGPGRPDGPEGRRPDGPPPRDREARGFDGPPPGPPRDRDGRGPEGRRGPRGERGPEGRGPEGRNFDDRGPGGPPPGGPPPEGPPPGAREDGPPGPPNPERLFNRFDENKDESLSKDEFKKLTDFMREHRPLAMRERMREGRGPDGPPRGEGRRGRRPGPPGPPPRPEDRPESPPGASSSDASSVEGTAADETVPAEEPVDAV